MHTLNAAWQRYVLFGIGMAASLILLAASMSMNFKYGYSMGRSSYDGYIYGFAAAAADIFMALSPFYFFAAFHNREVVRGLAALMVWTITAGFACTSAIGHASLNRLDVSSKRAVTATSYQDVRTDLAAARTERGFVPEHRHLSVEALKAEIEKHKIARAWSQTNECTEISGNSARAYCSTYQALNAEMGDAMRAEKLDARIRELQAKSDKVVDGSTAVQSEADPQATTVSFMTGMSLRSSQGLLIVTIVLMILCGGGLGPYVSASVLRYRKDRVIDADATDITPIITPAPAAQLAIAAPNLTAQGQERIEPKLGSQKKSGRPEPNSTAKKALQEAGYPATPFPKNAPLRSQEGAKDAAKRFMIWLGAFDLGGDKNPEEVWKLYCESAAYDHRVPQSPRLFKDALAKLKRRGGVDKSTPRIKGTDQRIVRWHLRPPKYRDPIPEKKAQATHEPKPAEVEAAMPTMSEERKVFTLLPFSPGGSPEPSRLSTRRWFSGDHWTNQFGFNQQIVQAKAHAERREGRNRKQRGSRVARLTRSN